MPINYESFDMRQVPEGLDKRYLVKVIAKTEGITDHTNDKTLPPEQRKKRLYTREELAAGARSLSLRPINVNHQKLLDGAYTIFSKINELGQVEVLCYLPDENYRQKLIDGRIENVSIDDVVFDEIELPDGTMKQGEIVFTGLALVEPPFVAGDKNTSVKLLYEAMNIHCEVTGIAIDASLNVKGKPFASYADFADCVAKNQDKEDPKAYCGAIQAQAEAVKKETVEKTVFDAEVAKREAAEKRVAELEPAVSKLQENVTKHAEEKRLAVETAVKDAKYELIGKIEAVIPRNMVLRQGSGGLVRLTQDIKKVLRDEADTAK